MAGVNTDTGRRESPQTPNPAAQAAAEAALEGTDLGQGSDLSGMGKRREPEAKPVENAAVELTEKPDRGAGEVLVKEPEANPPIDGGDNSKQRSLLVSKYIADGMSPRAAAAAADEQLAREQAALKPSVESGEEGNPVAANIAEQALGSAPEGANSLVDDQGRPVNAETGEIIESPVIRKGDQSAGNNLTNLSDYVNARVRYEQERLKEAEKESAKKNRKGKTEEAAVKARPVAGGISYKTPFGKGRYKNKNADNRNILDRVTPEMVSIAEAYINDMDMTSQDISDTSYNLFTDPDMLELIHELSGGRHGWKADPKKSDRENIDSLHRYLADSIRSLYRRKDAEEDRKFREWRNAPENIGQPDSAYGEQPKRSPQSWWGWVRNSVKLWRSTYEFEQNANDKEVSDGVSDDLGQPRPNVKVNSAQEKLKEDFAESIYIGFFHIIGERLVNGIVRYDREAENALDNLADLFNLHGIEGRQTVMRLIRCYATMSIDRNGKMFNEDADDWALSVDEVVKICELITASTKKYGHPFAMPVDLGRSFKLRGTEVFPSGVIPVVIAQAITQEGSFLKGGTLYNGKTVNHSITTLQQSCQDYWNMATHPRLIDSALRGKIDSEGKNKAKAQLICVEDCQMALSEIDGMTAERFSERYGIDTTPHYKYWEYLEDSIEYATAANGRWNAEQVEAERRKTLEEYQRKADKNSGRLRKTGKPFRKKWTLFDGEVHESNLNAGANFIANCAKTFSLIERPAIILSSIPEKGIGNFMANLAVRMLGVEHQFSDETWQRFNVKNPEVADALKAYKTLADVGGKAAMTLFSETKRPCTTEQVTDWLRNEYFPKQGKAASWMNQKLSQLEKTFLIGDFAFQQSDMNNLLMAMMALHEAEARSHESLERGSGTRLKDAKTGEEIRGSLALTGQEFEDTIWAHENIAYWFTEMMGTDAGAGANNMMRAFNIAQPNPLRAGVQSFLAKHGVTNATIVLMLDTFPTYGINFIYNMFPFSRTFSYLAASYAQHRGSLTAGDYVIGGNLSNFWEGLKFNMFYDGLTIGRFGATALLTMVTLMAIGFDPPDDEKDIYNISKWKIGSNLGLGPDVDGDGKGDGMEIQLAFWINDLTLLGLPIGLAGAVALRTGDSSLAANAFMDSLADQFDGNVVLDCADLINNYREVMFDFEEMSKDPGYVGVTSPISYGLLMFENTLLHGLTKLDPLGPAYSQIGRSALIRGNDARAFDTRRVWNRDTEWTASLGAVKNVDDPYEYIFRRNCVNSPFLATWGNLSNSMSNNPSTKTGYYWWEMPPKTMGDPAAYVWAARYTLDYDNMGDMTQQQYERFMVSQLLDDIAQLGTPDNAIKNYGFFIPSKLRTLANKYLVEEKNRYMNEWANKKKAGEYTYEEAQEAYDAVYDRWAVIDAVRTNWLKNSNIPEFGARYEQLLTDYDITYVDRDTGKPVQFGAWARLFNNNIEAVYEPKGNHPTSLLPFTVVDYSDSNGINRDFSGETVPYWVTEGTTGTDIDAFREFAEGKIVPYGRDAGKDLADVSFLLQENGEYAHPNMPTINYRAYVPTITYIPSGLTGSPDLVGAGAVDLMSYGDSGASLADVASGVAGGTEPLGTRDGTDVGSISAGVAESGGETGGAGDGVTGGPGVTSGQNGGGTAANPSGGGGVTSGQNGGGSAANPGGNGSDASNQNGSGGSPGSGGNGGGTSGQNNGGNTSGSNGNGGANGTNGATNWAENPNSLINGSKNNPSNSNLPNDKLSPELFNYDMEDAANYDKDAAEFFKNKGKGAYTGAYTYGGSRGSYGIGSSSGSGSYLPKIYSNARTLNSDRPYSLGSTRPSSSNVTYLRPSVETKGSREAYRRQDF